MTPTLIRLGFSAGRCATRVGVAKGVSATAAPDATVCPTNARRSIGVGFMAWTSLGMQRVLASLEELLLVFYMWGPVFVHVTCGTKSGLRPLRVLRTQTRFPADTGPRVLHSVLLRTNKSALRTIGALSSQHTFTNTNAGALHTG